jgi:hypothetical protein
MTCKIFSFFLVFVFTYSAFGLAERDFRSKNGQVIRGTIEKYFEDGDVLLKAFQRPYNFFASIWIFSPRTIRLSSKTISPPTTMHSQNFSAPYPITH